jgi:uridine kinase
MSSSSASNNAAKPVELIAACITGAAIAYSLLASYTSPPRASSRNDSGRRKADEGELGGSGFAACIPPSVRTLLPRPRKRTDSIVAIDEPPGLTKESVEPMMDHLERQINTSRPPASGPLTVGVAGGSGSGKTTFARALYEALGEEHVTYITHDSYYKDLSHLSLAERAKANFDHPNALDTALLVEHLRALKRGESVEVPEYCFATHARLARTITMEPRRVILVEGILIFADRALVQELAIKVFVDTESDLRLIRRIHRDVKERGRSLESIVDQYVKTVRPMHMDFVEPSNREADVIIPLGMNQVALDMFLSRLQAEVADQLPQSTPRTPQPLSRPPPPQKKDTSFIALGKQGSLSLSLGSSKGKAGQF